MPLITYTGILLHKRFVYFIMAVVMLNLFSVSIKPALNVTGNRS
jgi:hypothetical protein